MIGAGMAGLVAADRLRKHGCSVTVLEKSRGVGGRIATRRLEDGSAFDHGAQYFTARDPAFVRQVDDWLQRGIVEPWKGRIVSLDCGQVDELHDQPTRYVGVPGMNAIAKSLASDLDIRLGVTAQAVLHEGAEWRVQDSAQTMHGPFDLLLVSAPAPQTAALLREVAPTIATRLPEVAMSPCWAVMLQFAEPLALSFDGAFVERSPLSWIARNSSKPQRSATESWVLHAAQGWSVENLELSPDDAARRLVAAFWEATGRPSQTPLRQLAHRWRFALPLQPLTERHLLDWNHRVGVCGDWCGGPRVEGAYLSGLSLATELLALL